MTPITEDRLRDALESLAEQVPISPDAYARAHAEWRRRERRRRIRVLVIAIVIIAIADALGLWALNQARSGSPVLFGPSVPAHAVHGPQRIPVPPAGVVVLRLGLPG